MPLQIDFDIEPDEHGIIDGRDLAREMIGNAVALLWPYAADCPACTSKLFEVMANEVLEAAFDQGPPGVVLGSVKTAGEPGTPERHEAERRHFAAAQEATAELLRDLGDHPHKAHRGRLSPSSDEDISF